ncbi:MAG: hypothetical protein NC350_03565, partial [Corallococcus sp.]|nr:hypothetical protein [Corallococcus sp.]
MRTLKKVLTAICVLLVVGAIVGVCVAVIKPAQSGDNLQSMSFDPVELNTYLQDVQSSKKDIVALSFEPATANVDISKLTITSDNEQVATVSVVGDKINDGVIGVEVNQIADGTATVTSSYGDITATLNVDVTVLFINVGSMTFSDTESTVYLTDEPPFVGAYTLNFSPATANFKEIQFSSTDRNVAYVAEVGETPSADGQLYVGIIGVGAGTATITATFEDISCSIAVTVIDRSYNAVTDLFLYSDTFYEGNACLNGET